MKPKDIQRELLLKDLSSRVPYKPYCLVKDHDVPEYDEDSYEPLEAFLLFVFDVGDIDIKPFLRSLDSMTDEEKRVYHEKNQSNRLIGSEKVSIKDHLYRTQECIDWLIENHFDYRDLIPKGLAIEVKSYKVFK